MQYVRSLASYSAVLMLALPGAVHSQGSTDSYPSKPVVWIASYAVGGPNDQETRLYATKMNTLLGQQFVVDYKGGAGGTIGYAYVARAAPDGYTLLMVTGSFTTIPALYRNLSFDTLKDFAPVTLISKRPSVLVVNSSFPAKTFAEYIAYAKNNPNKINVGSAGAGGISHLAVALVHSLTKTKVTYVHYKGMGAVLPDLLAGRVDVASVALLGSLPLIKSGKVRALALTDDKRSSLLADLPTVAEQGIPEYSVPNWLGYLAPAATSPAIVNKLSDVFANVAKAPEVAAPLEAGGTVLVGSTAAEFKQFLARETGVWRKVIQENAITLEE